MCEKVWIILLSNYFCVHLPCPSSQLLSFSKIINFIAIQSVHVCPVACYRYLKSNTPLQ
jgi:hypothetical protein